MKYVLAWLFLGLFFLGGFEAIIITIACTLMAYVVMFSTLCFLAHIED